VNDRQREALLDRIYRESGTVGGSIPDPVQLREETVPLGEFCFEVARRETS